ncbi:MAG: parD4 [Chthonomonadaceae bacterium]|nr:parD4 [Chthonomonadaceae bacterium]
MNVSLTPELEQLVNNKVKSGMYHSASEVIREGLRLLKEQDDLRQSRINQLRQEVDIGVTQIERGQYTDYDVENLQPLVDEIKTKAGETLDKALAALLEEADRIVDETPIPPTDPQKKAFGELVDEKYRKMGFHL